ncbi:Mis6-domain-containing protein [Sphaerosporella brunnea]|uniref:Mis6-domain-containing protein n=1 Tax=Sphaerosporella brunnea TaxID=1250544 RepID=A0A5J5EL58_9PEZI|nr:Mis6-domain-containing protein [Sphaerosporella brunnea]
MLLTWQTESRPVRSLSLDASTCACLPRTPAAASERKAVPEGQFVRAINGLSQHAKIRGLAPDVLDTLIDALTKAPSFLNQTASARIVKALIPRRKVSEENVLTIVGCLGIGVNKPSLATQQAALLRWLVMVYNVLEDYTILSRMYGVLFNLLDMITLRAHICHLLSLVTRRKHIKPFRIQALLQLKQDVGNEQHVNALLQTYKNYYPDIIVAEVGPFRAGVFSHPSPEWMQQVLAIQEANAANNPNEQQKSAFKVVRQVNGKRRKADRSVIPEVHTFGATEASVALEDVQDVDDFVQKLDKLELPNQLVAVLEDPLLQKYLALRPSATSNERINNWLAACLEDELRLTKSSSTPGAAARTGMLLSQIVKYTRFTRQLLPSVEDYLRKYLQQWDGRSSAKSILALASFLPLRDFEQLHTHFLKPIEKVTGPGSEVSAADLLGFYTALLRNWAVTYVHRMPEKEPLDVESACLQAFVNHVGTQCLKVIQDAGNSTAIGHAVLTFYECASALPWENGLFRLVLPPGALVYYYLFLGNLVMFSRLCSVLVKYKAALELKIPIYHMSFVDHFNGYIMDLCNCLWRNRALAGAQDKDNRSAHACTIPENVTEALRTLSRDRGTDIRQMYVFSFSPYLARLAAICFRELEKQQNAPVRHFGPVTSRTLLKLAADGGVNITYAAYRVAVLEFLKSRGFKGISEFMHATMQSLKNPPAANAAASASKATPAAAKRRRAAPAATQATQASPVA